MGHVYLFKTITLASAPRPIAQAERALFRVQLRMAESMFMIGVIGFLASDFKCPDRGKGKGNFEVPFSRFPERFRARSRLYRSQILQVNPRWKALVEIYTMHSFAPFWNP